MNFRNFLNHKIGGLPVYLSQTAPKLESKQFFLLLLPLNKEMAKMASSKEAILAYEWTLQVTNNFSKFVNKSEVPCAAILLSAIDFASAFLGRTYGVSFKFLNML